MSLYDHTAAAIQKPRVPVRDLQTVQPDIVAFIPPDRELPFFAEG